MNIWRIRNEVNEIFTELMIPQPLPVALCCDSPAEGERLSAIVSKSTRDLLLVGDNLTYLEFLATNNEPLIDFIYIDPPYNTGSKFLYQDTRRGGVHPFFGAHSEWMGFMTPRLAFARELLKSTGVIAVSIDDYEEAYLKILMDRIFGPENFIGSVVVARSKNGKGSRRNIATAHEYLLVYGKTLNANLRGMPDRVDSYIKRDQFGSFKIDGLFRKKGSDSLRQDRPNMFYPLYYDGEGNVYVKPGSGRTEVLPLDSRGIERRWLWGRETASEQSWKLYASPGGTIYVKNYYSTDKRTKIRSLWGDDPSYFTERATAEIKKIYGDKVFDTPKPLKYISDIIDSFCENDALILDFFAGSGTTAHAAEALNLRDGGSRRVILMETGEEIPPNHLAFHSGFREMWEVPAKRLEYVRKSINPSYAYEIVELFSQRKIPAPNSNRQSLSLKR